MDKINLKKNETLDDLQVKGYKIIQSNDHFKFSIDAVLLSHYLKFKPNDIVLDMCAGTGIISLLVSAHNIVARIDSIEILEPLVDMNTRSIKYNDLTNIIYPYQMDLRNAPKELGYEKYDAIVCNPPYLPVKSGKANDTTSKAIARFEILCDLNDVIGVSSKLLKNGGKLALSHRAQRLGEIIALMIQHKIQPKRCRFVHSKKDDNAVLLLIEGVKNAKANMIIEPPLILYDENNNYTDEVYKIYKMDK